MPRPLSSFDDRTVCSPRALVSTNASTAAEIGGAADYKDQVGGVVPGYAGHMPRSRDKYAGSAHGGIAPERGPPPAKGPQQGHLRPEDVIPPVFEAFIASERGVMPGYTGFRPEARHVHNVSAFGGIVATSGIFGNARGPGATGGLGDATKATNIEELSQGTRSFDWQRNPVIDTPPSFRDNVGGVLPGYTGHVPRATEKHGTSHFGGLSPDKAYVPLAQTGHEGYKIDPGSGQAGEKDVELKMIPNYRAHRPLAHTPRPCLEHKRPSRAPRYTAGSQQALLLST